MITSLTMNHDSLGIIAKAIKASKESSIAPLLLGEPGIGKSSVVRSLCEENDWDFFELLVNQLGDKTDLTGARSVKSVENVNGKDEEIWKQIFFPHQSVQDALTRAKDKPDRTIVLFLDEINRSSSDITSAVMSFTTSRKIGTYYFPSNIAFVIAGNDSGNIIALDSASLSRFAIFKLRPSAATWLNITTQVNPYIKAVLDKDPSLIFCKCSNTVAVSGKNDDDDDDWNAELAAFDEEAEGFNQITTPRTISGLNVFLNDLTNDELKYYLSVIEKDQKTGEDVSLLAATIKGYVGDTAFAAELIAQIATAVANNMMANASTVALPKRPQVLTPLASAPTRQAQEDMISKLDFKSRSELLAYLVYQPGANNTDIIRLLASAFTEGILEPSVMPNFAKLKSLDKLDPNNYAALLDSNTPIGIGIKSVLGD